MGLFGRRRPERQEDGGAEHALKGDLEGEVEALQGKFREASAQLDEVTGRLRAVREEYDTAVANLMMVKKETNQKKAELEGLRKARVAGSRGGAAGPGGRPTLADGPGPRGVIEAASAVVGSLKSRLAAAERELEDARRLLEEERRGHGETRGELERLRKGSRA